MLAEEINKCGGTAAVLDPKRAMDMIENEEIDCIVLMGAGDLEEYKNAVIEKMRQDERK